MEDFDSSNVCLERPCPICKTMSVPLGKVKGKTLLSCGHSFKFKMGKDQKLNRRKYQNNIDIIYVNKK